LWFLKNHLRISSLSDMREITYRDLTSLADFARVVDLEQEIWGPG